MKSLLLVSACALTFYSTSQTFYFSNQPISIGQEQNVVQQTSFTTDEHIYGLCVFDTELVTEFPGDERALTGIRTTVDLFGKTSSIDKSRVSVHNGKTYVHYDIFPEAAHSCSPDYFEWYQLYGKKEGSYKVKILSVEGRSFPRTQVSGIELKIKNTSGSLWDLMEPVYEKEKERMAKEGVALEQNEYDAESEQQKLSASLPEAFKNQHSSGLVGFTPEDAINYMFEQGYVLNKNQVKWINYFTEWGLNYYDGLNYRSAEIGAVYTTAEGDCAYIRLWVRQDRLNAIDYTKAYPLQNYKSMRQYYNCSKE